MRRTPVQRARRAEFEALALPHVDSLYGAALRLTRNAGDAEDLVQDTLLRAYRFWDGFTRGSNCKAWLFKILTNTFINNYQKKKRSREVLSAAIAEQKATDGVLHHEDSRTQRSAEELLLQQCLSEDVERALADLPVEFRTAVVLCDIQGFCYKEIAEIVDCPLGTVMSRLYRGRRLLQKQLRRYAIEQGIVRETDATSDTQSDDGRSDDGAVMISLDNYRNSNQ